MNLTVRHLAVLPKNGSAMDELGYCSVAESPHLLL
jgi:hypothetical protein